MDQELQAMIDCQELTLYDSDRIPYGPSLEIMEEELKGFFYEIYHSGPYTISYPIRGDNYWKARSDTLLKALIKLYMWVNHGKEWKEGEWK